MTSPTNGQMPNMEELLDNIIRKPHSFGQEDLPALQNALDTLPEPPSEDAPSLMEMFSSETHQNAQSIEAFGDRLLAQVNQYARELMEQASAARDACYDFAKAMRTGGDEVAQDMENHSHLVERATSAIEAARKEFEKANPLVHK